MKRHTSAASAQAKAGNGHSRSSDDGVTAQQDTFCCMLIVFVVAVDVEIVHVLLLLLVTVVAELLQQPRMCFLCECGVKSPRNELFFGDNSAIGLRMLLLTTDGGLPIELNDSKSLLDAET